MIGVDGEIILPGRFLPIAERRGMIRTVDRWVIRQAVGLLEDLAITTRHGAARRAPPLRLHVNISGRSLADGDLLGCIRTQLSRSGVDPSQLVFEITETAAILKIDGQSIQNLTTNPDDLVVVESLVRMSGGLRMLIAAECVEDAATLQLLVDLGVGFAQGFHIGRPGPARQVIGSRWTTASAPAPGGGAWPTSSTE